MVDVLRWCGLISKIFFAEIVSFKSRIVLDWMLMLFY